MTRRLPTYTPAQIRDALRTAVLQTGWSETSPDTASVAAWRLAGYQADDVALDHAEAAVAAYQAGTK